MIDKHSGDLRFVIETPKGCRNKYRYEPDGHFFELATVLPEGMNFPFDFGFIPSTLGGDGDPLDILLLMDAPASPGIVIRGRLIGALVARQKERGQKWERNDRLIGVATHARTHESVKSLDDLRPNTLRDIKQFFVDYNELRDRKFDVEETCGPQKAMKLLKAGARAFRKAGRSAPRS